MLFEREKEREIECAWKLCNKNISQMNILRNTKLLHTLKMWTLFLKYTNKCHDNFPLDSPIKCFCLGFMVACKFTICTKGLFSVVSGLLTPFYSHSVSIMIIFWVALNLSVLYTLFWCERSEMRTIVCFFYSRFCQSGCGFSSRMPSSERHYA